MSWRQQDMSDNRALLASPGLDGQPVKGVYFFPGEAARNLGLYTVHPFLADDQHWNSDPSSRMRVMDRMVAAHVNAVVMSYWSNMPNWSPMVLDPNPGSLQRPPHVLSTSLSGVLDAVRGRRPLSRWRRRSPLVIVPAIERGFSENQALPQWRFARDFPAPMPGGPVAPGLIERIGWLVELFRRRMDLWARLYDRNGDWRDAVQILHVYSEIPGTTDIRFAQAFGDVAAEVWSRYQIRVGFLLDIIGGALVHGYVATPAKAGRLLEEQPSVLAVNGFASEVWSDKVRRDKCQDPDWRRCHPHDNNRDNLERLADWKRAAVHDWVNTGLPLILDVTMAWINASSLKTRRTALASGATTWITRSTGGATG
jgi:hypothetical protein